MTARNVRQRRLVDFMKSVFFDCFWKTFIITCNGDKKQKWPPFLLARHKTPSSAQNVRIPQQIFIIQWILEDSVKYGSQWCVQWHHQRRVWIWFSWLNFNFISIKFICLKYSCHLNTLELKTVSFNLFLHWTNVSTENNRWKLLCVCLHWRVTLCEWQQQQADFWTWSKAECWRQ